MKRFVTGLFAASSAAGCAGYKADADPAPIVDAATPLRKTIPSNADFATTDARLKAAIESRGLTLFTVVDHGAGAESAGLELGASKLYLFGNPKAGTPLMQADPQFGLDLPLKALVYETEAGVFVTTPDIDALAATHGVDGLEPLRGNIAKALGGIAAEAASGA
ncbi:MAG: DUF302 domain-containing protein [Pseudomonadota bacterium]